MTKTETPADKVQRNIARRSGAEYGHAEQPGLPTADHAELVTLTLDELHDLMHAAIREASTTVATVSDPASRRLADRACTLGRIKAQAHDGYHRGTDPRG
jgi:hypothetical protein